MFRFAMLALSGVLLLSAPAAAASEVAQVGQNAPDFTLASLNGTRMKLSALRGTPVVLNFFATWCHPCQAEMPHLGTVAKTFDGRVQVIAVNLTVSEASQAAVRKFVEKHGFAGPVLLDRTGEVSNRYLVRAIPVTVAISASGKVLAIVPGQQTEDGFLRLMTLAEKGMVQKAS